MGYGQGARPSGCEKAKVIQVIETIAKIGRGTENDPLRWIIQYWDFDGNMLAEHDTIVNSTDHDEEA